MMRRAVCLYHRIYINARVCWSRWFTDGVKGIHHRLHRCGASADTDIHGLGKISLCIRVRRRRYQIHQWFRKHCAMRSVLDAQE